MLDFIIKYWVQFLFGLAAACFTFIIKQYYTMKDKIKQQEIEDIKNKCVENNLNYAEIYEHAFNPEKQEQAQSTITKLESLDKINQDSNQEESVIDDEKNETKENSNEDKNN